MKEFLSFFIQESLQWFETHGIKILLIFISAYLLRKLGTSFIAKAVRVAVVSEKYPSKEAEIQRENTLIRIFSTTFQITIVSISIALILQELGVVIGTILAGAGVVGLALGFGGQYLMRDIISGLFIILENQYRIGDVVNIENIGGVVENITLRMTTLRDLDGIVHHIPHGEVKKVSNLSKDFARININLGVAYNSHLEHVIQVINNTGAELADDPAWKDFIIKPPQFLRIDDFADSAIIIKVLGETKPLKQWDVSGEFRKRIIQQFEKEKIEIPFPQRVIHLAQQPPSK